MIENQVGGSIKKLRTNNGLEYCSNEFNNICMNEGITRHIIVVHTTQKNGLVERMNMTLIERVKNILNGVILLEDF